MTISKELTTRILGELERYRPELLSRIPSIQSKMKYVVFPVCIDGVMDRIRFNVSEKRFDQLEVRVARKGIVISDMLPKHVAYCDHWEKEIIELHGY